MSKLVHPEPSYQVRGVLFDVYNALGPILKEQYGLKKHGVACEAEKAFKVYYEGERVGLYYVDVWMEDGKIVLEIKAASAIEPIHKAHLRRLGLKLGLLPNFHDTRLATTPVRVK